MTITVRVACVLAFFCAALAGQVTWTDMTPGPYESSGHAMAYDSQRGKTVLFGGTQTLGDTWEWDGTTWTRVATTGPSARRDHAMAYDSQRGKTVLFGGQGAAGLFGDTWEWDGTSWTQVASSGPGPGPHSGHAMAYDSQRGKTVLFVGDNGSGLLFGDTWEWNGTTWTQVATTYGPPGQYRSFHAMAYDSQRGRTVLFGGDPYYPQGDTWEWNGTSWTQVAPSGPSARYGHAMAYDSVRGKTVLFGGRGTVWQSFGDTWEWDGTSWTQVASSGSAPSDGSGNAMAFDSGRGRTVLFGHSSPPGLTSEWDGSSWTQVATPGPNHRYGHAMAYDSLRGRTVLFGGNGFGVGSQGDTWEWDGTSWTQVATTGPSARGGHSMAYDSQRGRTVLFGGDSGGFALGDTWEWDGTSWTQVASSGPGPFGQAMAYDSARGKTVLFGGLSLGDTWEWDGASWTQFAYLPVRPSARYGHAMAYDSARGKTVLFGGSVAGGTQTLGDTWEWSGTNWTQVATTYGPSARYLHAMAYDSVRGRTVLFGGAPYNPLADTWEWNGTSWTQVANTRPSARFGHSMAYDSQRARTVLFGGARPGFPFVPNNDTWETTPPTIAAVQAYGTSCGSPPITLAPSVGSRPILGQTQASAITNAFYGFAAVVWGVTNQTLPLDFLGINGCTLWNGGEGEIGSFCASTSVTTAQHNFAIPFDMSLLGVHVYLQAWTLAPGYNPFGISMSNGLELVIGDA